MAAPGQRAECSPRLPDVSHNSPHCQIKRLRPGSFPGVFRVSGRVRPCAHLPGHWGLFILLGTLSWHFRLNNPSPHPWQATGCPEVKGSVQGRVVPSPGLAEIPGAGSASAGRAATLSSVSLRASTRGAVPSLASLFASWGQGLPECCLGGAGAQALSPAPGLFVSSSLLRCGSCSSVGRRKK